MKSDHKTDALVETAGQLTAIDATVIESLALKGDLSGLSSEQRVAYYTQLCHRLKLDPAASPFVLLATQENGRDKLSLYAAKGCADQLARNNRLTRQIVGREIVGGAYVVTCRATLPDGRTEDGTGVVAVVDRRVVNGKWTDVPLAGDRLANAYMKAETKAKRRTTLSILGLGMLDESEVDSIPGARSFNPGDDVPPPIATQDLGTVDLNTAADAADAPGEIAFNPKAENLGQLVSPKQLGMIGAKMAALHITAGRDDPERDVYVGKIWPGIRADELSREAASLLIDHLKDLEAGGTGTLEFAAIDTKPIEPAPISDERLAQVRDIADGDPGLRQTAIDELSRTCKKLNATAVGSGEIPWTPELLVEFIAHVSGEAAKGGTARESLSLFSLKALVMASGPLSDRLRARETAANDQSAGTPEPTAKTEEELEAEAIAAEANGSDMTPTDPSAGKPPGRGRRR